MICTCILTHPTHHIRQCNVTIGIITATLLPWCHLLSTGCLPAICKSKSEKTDYFLKTFSGVSVGLFEYVNACVISFRYSWATMKNNLSYIFLQKGEISGLAQISTISADWIFGVSIFGLNHFKTILNQFYKLLCLSCCLNFLKHPQLFGCKSSHISPNVL